MSHKGLRNIVTLNSLSNNVSEISTLTICYCIFCDLCVIIYSGIFYNVGQNEKKKNMICEYSSSAQIQSLVYIYLLFKTNKNRINN